jgi:hypothetical protein
MNQEDGNKQVLTPTLEYLAGYFEGEGSICFTDKKFPQLKVKIKSGDHAILVHFYNRFGGSFNPVKISRKHNRQIHEWIVTNTKAQEVLKELRPFFQIKGAIADSVLTLQFNTKSEARRLAPEQWQLRREVAEQVSAFNNRITIN